LGFSTIYTGKPESRRTVSSSIQCSTWSSWMRRP